jgi:hypothetical protein
VGATLFLGVGVGVATAATTVTLSSSEFAADTTGAVMGDFDGVSPLPYCSTNGCFGGFASLSIGGATFTTPNSGGEINVNSANYNGPSDQSSAYLVSSQYSGGAPDIIDIALSPSTTAFGLDFDTLFNSTTATFTLSNGYSTVVSNTSTEGDAEFIGFLSSTPISSVQISVPDSQSVVVSDFVTATATTVSAAPEPSIWLLMIFGLGGIGLMLRRAKAGLKISAAATTS